MIRATQPSDSAAILSIWNPIIRDGVETFNSAEKTEDDVAGMIANAARAGHGFWVAEVEGAVQGFAYYGAFRGGVGYARTKESTIYLAPAAQGRGLGRALMQVLEDHARAAGVHAMMAGVSAENPAGRLFHEKLGYRFVARLPEVGFKFGRSMDLDLLQKFL